jgi:hypothetical protein
MQQPYDYGNISYPVGSISGPTVNPPANTFLLVDASAGEVNITIPAVVPGNFDFYSFTLLANGNHANISVDGGQQIQGLDTISISTENSRVLLKSNGVDRYEIVDDSRLYYRVNTVSESISLVSGFESGGLYVGTPPDSVAIEITIADWETAHVGDKARFVKSSGDNAVVRIKSVSGSFNEIISENDTGFEVTVGPTKLEITQDSRPKESNIRVNFYPGSGTSQYEGINGHIFAGVLYSSPQLEEVFTSPAITADDPLNPQSLGFFINDEKALIGALSDRNITAVAQVKKTVTTNRDIGIKFRYYEYDFSTNILNPVPLSETSYSSPIVSTAYNEVFVNAILPENTWATENQSSNKLLVIELLAVKASGGGDNPTMDFRFGGTTPSLTFIDVPVASVNHATLGGVVAADTGIPDGHVDSDKPLQLPELTTVQRDSFTPKAGMILYNTTTGQVEKYQAGSWSTL